MSTDRRNFLGTLVAAGTLPLVGKSVGRYDGTRTQAPPLTDLPTYHPSAASPWDVSWADKLTGKHKAVFDNVELGMGLGMLRALMWQKDYAEVYNATPADMSGVVVLRHGAIWAVMNDEFWKMHKLGELTKINDPATKAPITRNPFIGSNVYGLPPALADDVLTKCLATTKVLACNVAFSLYVVEKVKADTKMDDAKAREHALGYLIPGVTLQPSGVFASLRAQEAGCNYILATDA
jgi:hypothetical protein